MAKFMAPEGYRFDPQIGLYVKELLVTDVKGARYRHRMCFNPDTGIYTQISFPLDGQIANATKKTGTKKRGIIIAAVLGVLAVAAAVAFFISYKTNNSDAPFVLSDEEIEEIYDKYDFDTIPDSVLDLKEYGGAMYEGGIIR